MSTNSSNIDDWSSSLYYDAYSNSKELNDRVMENQKKQKEISESNSEKSFNSKSNYESPPPKLVNNNFNITNNSTVAFSSNRPSHLNNNLLISNKSNADTINKESDKSLFCKNSKKKVAIYLNNVKKKLLSPINENNNNNLEGVSKDDISNNNINDNNNNININIIINKKKKKKIENKYVYNNTNINNINNDSNDILNNKNCANLNKNINKSSSEPSIYSSMDQNSNSTLFKKYNQDKIKEIENDDEEEDEEELSITIKKRSNKNFSISESNSGKKSFFGNSLSESTIKKQNFEKNNNLSKENTVILDHYEYLIINSITFEDIFNDQLTVNDLKTKYNLREIPVKRKDISDRNQYLKTLIELQIFNFGNSPIWCMKINKNGKYLAAGNKEGKIRIYEIMGYDYEKYEKEYNSKNIMNFLHFLEEKPIKELYGHKSDITDLSWSPFKKNLLLSASVDHYVILWDIGKDENSLIVKYKHEDFVTSVQFSPSNKNLFVTGCLDKYVRIYNISNYINQNNDKNTMENQIDNKDININVDNNIEIDNIEKNNKKNKKMLKESVSGGLKLKDIKNFVNITDKITSVSYFPDGNQLAIGSINGKINIYDLFENNARYNHSFTCRNRVGKNSLGKKITSIVFINKNNAIITTCDSCIRLVSMNEGKNLLKYKGYSNENSWIRSSVDFSSDVIISGSENGFCYVWHILSEEKKKKIYDYEYFQPFSKDIVECSICIEEKCFVNYVKKVLKLTNKINVISIIINSTDKGKIEVLLNIDEEMK